MRIDDRFDDLVASLGGFYRTWYVFVGLELGLLQRLRDAGAEGLTPAELARRTGTEPRLVTDWAWGADAHDIVTIEDGRDRASRTTWRSCCSTPTGPEYLGGQFLHAATGSLDYGAPARGVPHRHAGRRRGPTATGSRSSGSPSRTSRCSSRRSCAAVPQLVAEPAAREPDPRHPLRRRPLADRDGAPVPGHRAHGRGVRARFRGPCPRRRHGGGAVRPDHHRAGRRRGRSAHDGRVQPRLLPVRPPPAPRCRRRRSGRRGTRCGRAGLAGRARLVPADGPGRAPVHATASCSPGCSWTSWSRGRAWCRGPGGPRLVRRRRGSRRRS